MIYPLAGKKDIIYIRSRLFKKNVRDGESCLKLPFFKVAVLNVRRQVASRPVQTLPVSFICFPVLEHDIRRYIARVVLRFYSVFAFILLPKSVNYLSLNKQCNGYILFPEKEGSTCD